MYYKLLTIVFVTLKLCSVITWSWIWVLSPVWIIGCLHLFSWCCGKLQAMCLAKAASLATPQEKLAAACRKAARAYRK